MNATTEIRLTSFSHGGGCGCKIAPGVLLDILKSTRGLPVMPPSLQQDYNSLRTALLSSGFALAACRTAPQRHPP